MPPKSCFTTIIAITLPSIACQIGIVTGRLKASRIPVTIDERSETVFSLLQSFSKRNSESTQVPTHTATIRSARQPKIIAEAISAGTSAMITSSIIICVLRGVWKWGETVEISLFIICPPFCCSGTA